jgi:AcrR family transcriptional regulator
MHLYAVRQIEDVTVADIAEEAKMTPAAVYYHYASKEDVLLEGLREFATGLQAELERLLHAGSDGPISVGAVEGELLTWAQAHRSAAVVWFVKSPGMSEPVEALRRKTRLEMVEAFSAVFRTRSRSSATAQASVTALALVILLEQAAVCVLTEDVVLANLGGRRFTGELGSLADLIASPMM